MLFFYMGFAVRLGGFFYGDFQMPFDSEGNFTRVHNWENDRQADLDIVSDRHDEEDDNFAEGFNECMLRDGRATMQGDLNMGNFQIRQVANGTVSGDAVNYGQLQKATSDVEQTITTKFENIIYNTAETVTGGAVVLKPTKNLYVATISALPFTLSFDATALDNTHYATFELRLVKNIAGAITFPGNIAWEFGITPDFEPIGNYYLAFRREVGGTKWLANLQGRWS